MSSYKEVNGYAITPYNSYWCLRDINVGCIVTTTCKRQLIVASEEIAIQLANRLVNGNNLNRGSVSIS